MSVKPVIHLIPNAHLDPVWLWDWREGFTEMIATTRTILDLMDEFPELTFVRGEAMLYRHIEQVDPGTFRRVLACIGAERWDVVGGMMVQPDMNLPATETCIRHLLHAQRYLKIRSRVVVPVDVPAMGWKVLEFAYEEGAPSVPVPDPVVAGETSLSNGMWDVSATPGDAGIRVRRAGMPVLDEPGLSALTVEDPWGVWGDLNDSPATRSTDSISRPQATCR